MENPTRKTGYTKEELKQYAEFRKKEEQERLSRLEKIISENDNYEELEQYHEEQREPLSFEKKTVIEILLSWGGDSDGYKLTFDNNNDLEKVIYFWSDWGVYEEVTLEDDEAEQVYNIYLYGDVTAYLQ